MTPVIEHHQSAIAPIRIDRLLDAIGAVESGYNDKAVGAKGERGMYQMTYDAWRSVTRITFDKAFIHAYSMPVARAYLLRLRWDLADRHVTVTVRNLARAWNPHAPPEYSQRVEALYNDR